ncbi:lipopolysaccharide biosynthesis protein [Duganella sp. BuS-21]
MLTRLLDARDIGAVAFIGAIIAVLAAVVEMGLAEYLIYKEDTPAARNQIFWFQIYVTGAVFALTLLVGPPLLHHLGQHDAAAMLPYLGLMLPLAALTSVQDAIQRRALQFKAIAMRSLIGMLAGAVVGVGLAFWGAGMWSLVFKQLTETIVMALVMWRMSDWRPGWRCDWSGFRRVFDYGRYMAGGRLLDVFTLNVDDLIVGVVVGQQQLGFYSIGKKLYAISIELLAGVTQQISGPLFAKADGDRRRLWNMFLEAVRYCAWLIIPLYVALYFFAPTIVPLLFGQHWAGAVWILQSFCIVGMLFPFYQFNWPLIMAGGRAASSFHYSLVRNIGGLVILFVASYWGWQAVVMAQVARILFNIGSGWVFLRSVIAFQYAALGRAVVPGLCTAAAVAAIFYLLSWAVGNVFLVQAAGVALVLGAGYLLMLLKFKRSRK